MTRSTQIPIAKCPDAVLEQIAHAGDCAITDWPATALPLDGRSPIVLHSVRRACSGGARPQSALRDLWPDWKGDDRWWCKPYDARVRPEESFPGGERDSRAHATRKV